MREVLMVICLSSLYQEMVGLGLPDAGHSRVMVWLTTTSGMDTSFDPSILAGTVGLTHVQTVTD